MTDGRDDSSNRLARIERLLEDGGRDVVPAWRRVTRGETRWAVSAVILVALALQLMLPHRLAFQPYWLLPALEIALMVGLFVANPRGSSPALGGCAGRAWS